ncbi:MAG: hypothetical protein J5716_07775 [Alphaproteobacteria bacterium]|nr:hypothetical protein [Alphaproteobacteria bacterium]
MNKILFLKILIAFITFLIFLTLGGIVYALVNYKTTPKLLSRKKAPVIREVKQTEPEKIPETYLELGKDEHIQESHACGNMLCLHVKSDFGNSKIIIFDPEALQIKAVLLAGQQRVTE